MAFGPAGMAVAAGVNAFISAAAGDSVGAAMFLGEAALGAAAGIARWARPAGSLIPVITNTGRTYSPLRTLPLPVRPPPVVPTVTNPGGGGCFAAGTPVATPGGSAPIEEVKVGSRVAGPVSGGDEKVETAVDPPNWRLVSLEMRSLDGTSTMHIQTLRSVQWLAENGYKVGGETWVHLEELGLQGACDIVGIQPCPLLAEGPGQIVLSTMQSRSTFLLEIRFQGVDPPLRVTAQHLLKDARSGEWIAAGLVKEGAVLTSRSGDRAVSSITPFPVPVEVFNLEVEHDHCYFAGSAQLLAHNAGCGTTWTSNSGPTVDLGTRSVGTAAKSAPAQFPQGSFSITDLGWQGYPAGVPKPAGPFRLLEGAEYDAARKAANQANNQIRVDQGLRGQPVDVHETQPVKFGGSATDPANKVILDRATHRQQVTPWWNNLMRRITGG